MSELFFANSLKSSDTLSAFLFSDSSDFSDSVSDDFSLTMDSLRKTGRVLVAEEVCAVGCIGRRILARASQASISLHGSRCINLKNGIVVHGSRDLLLCDYGLDAESLAASASDLVEWKKA